MNEEKKLRLKVASSPHVASPINTMSLMRDVLIALVPALCAAVFFFGPRALIATAVSVAACELFEWGYRKLMKKSLANQDLSAAVTLATKLRDAGVRTQLYTEQKKFKAKMNYADKTGVPYVVFLGEDEVKNNVIACKDMTSGEQTTLDFAATLARVRDGLAERNKGKVIVEK